MTINVWSYLEEYQEDRQEILDAVDRVFSSGRLMFGPEGENFEKEFADYCGVKYGVGLNSGTDALFLGLTALGIGEGDEVITVANTAVPTVSAIVSTGATPVFVDIEKDSCLMDLSKVADAISEKTRCIVPVHLYGQCVDMASLQKLAKAKNLFIVEDCAQSHGAKYKNQMAGSLSDLATFSFYPTKILGAYGDGGMVVTSNSELADKIKRLRYYGMEQKYDALEHGYNSRLDEVQAAILRLKLKKLDQQIEKRRTLADRYSQALADSNYELLKVRENNFHSYYLYVVAHPERDSIIEQLKQQDIHVNISYPWPVHTMEAYKKLGYKKGDLPVTEQRAGEIFSLPLYPGLSFEDQDQVIQALIGLQ